MYGIQIDYGTLSKSEWEWLANYEYPGIWKPRLFDSVLAAENWIGVHLPGYIEIAPLRILEFSKGEKL